MAGRSSAGRRFGRARLPNVLSFSTELPTSSTQRLLKPIISPSRGVSGEHEEARTQRLGARVGVASS